MNREFFITGCDKNTEWMIPWFLEGFRTHNKSPILIADFGMSPKMRSWCRNNFDEVIDIETTNFKGVKGWFMKPNAMIEASKRGYKTCWIDSDIQVLGDLSSIFDTVVSGKLSMVQDNPWVKRRNEEWYNSGVVAFAHCPPILLQWADKCKTEPTVGDQEVLHGMTNDPISKLTYIKPIHNKYNYLRLQIDDGDIVPDRLVIHWTGPKGKDEIRRQMNEKS